MSNLPLKELGQPKAGFHAFRRFRTTWLRKNRTPEDLIRFWLGHADETVTDGYSKLSEDVEYRKEVSAEVGLGFEISAQKPVVVPNVPNFAVLLFCCSAKCCVKYRFERGERI